MKQVIRLTENDLHKIVEESVRKILNEYGEGEGQEKLGTAYMMAMNRVRSMDGEDMERARRIANYAGEKRKKHGIPVDLFVKGMNKARNK